MDHGFQKANEKIINLKKQVVGKDAFVKLHTDNLNKKKAKIEKCKGEIKKLKKELKHTKVELNKFEDNAINIVKDNAYLIVAKFKKSEKFQVYLNFYGVRSFKKTYEDLRKYL